MGWYLSGELREIHDRKVEPRPEIRCDMQRSPSQFGRRAPMPVANAWHPQPSARLLDYRLPETGSAHTGTTPDMRGFRPPLTGVSEIAYCRFTQPLLSMLSCGELLKTMRRFGGRDFPSSLSSSSTNIRKDSTLSSSTRVRISAPTGGRCSRRGGHCARRQDAAAAMSTASGAGSFWPSSRITSNTASAASTTSRTASSAVSPWAAQ